MQSVLHATLAALFAADDPSASDALTGAAGWMTALIDVLGPAGVGVVILIETVFPPIPSEVVLPGAGYLAGLGELNIWTTLAFATLGSVVGAWMLYAVGGLVGDERLGRWVAHVPLVSDDDVARASDVFARHQRPAVFWGRLVPGVRSLISIPAGAQRMPLWQFTLLTAAGSLVWNSVLLGAGWWLGDSFGATATVSRWLNIVIYVGFAVFVAWFAFRRLRRRHRADRRTVTSARSPQERPGRTP